VIVRPDTWVLDRNKIPTFYMHHTAVRPKQRIAQNLEAKRQTFDQKFAEIKQLKEEGNKFFKDKNYDQAKDRYAQCIDGLNVSTIVKVDDFVFDIHIRVWEIHPPTSNVRICLNR
jgi:hypothetical protein